jgi:predicted transcriptional regulator
VSAYVSNNHIARNDLPALILVIHTALNNLATGAEIVAEEPSEKPTLAQIRKSITPDALISFVDGKAYKTLKRHLTKHGFNPDSYRKRFGLPGDYPMVSVSYSARRSDLARTYGIGSEYNRSRQADAVPQAKNGRRKGARST